MSILVTMLDAESLMTSIAKYWCCGHAIQGVVRTALHWALRRLLLILRIAWGVCVVSLGRTIVSVDVMPAEDLGAIAAGYRE